ncbi:MAG TPA: sulfotransferase [Sandaracinaceae bacterium]
MSERQNRLAVAICGAGHSGSTLLGLVLGSHSRAFYAGEAKKSLFVGDPGKPLRKRVCKICGEGCEVWSRFAGPRPDLYEALARITGKSVIVDSTKDVAWIRARAAELAAIGVPQRLVFLTRDGRAVVNSRLRKYGGADAVAIIDAWIAQVRATEALCAERTEECLRVRYEELATAPRETVERVCAFLGLAFEPAMLRYEQHAHHPLGGNTGTQSVVARALDARSGFAKVPDRSRAFYEGLRGGFRLDLRWREELPAEVLALFEERAGRDNAPYAWEEGA